jgi:signal transduction histidine kinase
MKLQFVSNVSHELRTPLTIIRESISLIDEEIGAKLASKQKELLDICNRNIDRLARLISDILDFQKLQSGKAIFELKEDDINDTILEVTQTMNTLLKDKNLKFSTDLDLRVPKLKYDKDKIIQVLTNIVNNAIKFTENGEIVILSRKNGNSVIVSVKDTGIGIKKDEIQKLFVPFAQLESSNERRRGGTGLGLSISKEIIEKHNGKIWVESGLGSGSTFCFTLPILERRGTGSKNEETNIISG